MYLHLKQCLYATRRRLYTLVSRRLDLIDPVCLFITLLRTYRIMLEGYLFRSSPDIHVHRSCLKSFCCKRKYKSKFREIVCGSPQCRVDHLSVPLSSNLHKWFTKYIKFDWAWNKDSNIFIELSWSPETKSTHPRLIHRPRIKNACNRSCTCIIPIVDVAYSIWRLEISEFTVSSWITYPKRPYFILCS